MPDTVAQAQTKGQVQYDASAAIVFTGQAQRMLAAASDFSIDSDDMLRFAGDDLMTIKALQKKVEEQRTAITGPMNQALRAINDLFRPPATFLQQAEDKLKSAMLTYTQEQQRKAEEARRKAEVEAAAARALLAQEQARQEAIAREAAQAAQRAAEEAAAAAARGDAETAAKATEEARQQSEMAQTAVVEAQAAEVTAAVVSMPVTVAAPARVAGISTSKSVDFEVVDLHALIKHVAEHPELVGLLTADTVRLRAQVKATGMKTILPGVRVFQKQTMAARASV